MSSPLNTIVEMLRGKRIVALSGAGISTESGIPDYRGPGTLARARKPLQYRQFMDSARKRQHYWSRSAIGWPRIDSAQPNAAHRALALLESRGLLSGIITQNVDRLHTKAGSQRVVELHGALADVRCISCQEISKRQTLQERLDQANPNWNHSAVISAPDGDAELEEARSSSYQIVACEGCEGMLKPDVVFFGESVPAPVVEQAWALYQEADALLVVGTSLTVFSGFRFVRRAAEDNKAIVIVNQSETRGDPLAQIVWPCELGTSLPTLAERLIEAAEG